MDAVVSPLSTSHSPTSFRKIDLPEACRVEVLDNFRQATIRWNRLARDGEAEGKAEKEEAQKSQLIVVTDACLPHLGS
ncbi:hypothetical protein OROGR_007872 [Orobanche gracilis]